MNGLLLVAMLLLAPNAHSSGGCYALVDADARVYCLAKFHRNPAHCYAIQDSAKRVECLVEIRTIQDKYKGQK